MLELATQAVELVGHRDRERFELRDLGRARLWIDVADDRPRLAPALELERVFGCQQQDVSRGVHVFLYLLQ